jgi:hypothetical protein
LGQLLDCIKAQDAELRTAGKRTLACGAISRRWFAFGAIAWRIGQ